MPTVDKEHIRQAFLDATLLTFKRMLFTEIEQVEQPESKVYDISAVIGFTGVLTGNAAIRFPYITIQSSTQMTIGSPDFLEADIADCAGELINIITGNAKASFSTVTLQLSFPEIIRGPGHTIDFQKFQDSFNLEFTSDLGPMQVVVAYNDTLRDMATL